MLDKQIKRPTVGLVLSVLGLNKGKLTLLGKDLRVKQREKSALGQWVIQASTSMSSHSSLLFEQGKP